MINEAFLQILQILAYLAIGLLSVTLPVYAICITYLRQEMWETAKDRRKRIGKLKRAIEKLSKELSGEKRDSDRFKEIQKEIEKYKSEMKSERVLHLTAQGAVVMPFVFLAIALLLAGVGLYFFYEGFQYAVYLCIVVSVASCGTAVYCLLKTLFAVEHAALRQARTVDFDVHFDFEAKGKKSKEVKLGEGTGIDIVACSEAQVVDYFLHFRIPAEIEVTSRAPAYESLTITKHVEHTTLTHYRTFFPEDLDSGVYFDVIPKKTGKYVIPVSIRGRGIREYRTELTLIVVE